MSETLLEAALRYAELGYKVFPCVPGDKVPATPNGLLDATTDEATICRWWTENRNYNVAIATTGLFVLDIDGKNNPWLKQIDASRLLAGAVQKTPRGGLHYVFKQNSGLRNTVSVLAPKVDTRADGGYIVVAPSSVAGAHYKWVCDLEDSPNKLPDAPAWLIEPLGVKPTLAKSDLDIIPERGRNNAMIRYAGMFRRSGLAAEEIYQGLLAVNEARCRPPLSANEIRKVALSAARYEPDIVEVALIYNHFAYEGANKDAEPETGAPMEIPAECITGLPLYMRMAWEWSLNTAINRQPELSLAGIIPLFGCVLGRKVRDDYGTRTNVMTVGLAPSGGGKEHPRTVNKRILMAADLNQMNGPERFASHSGIISALAENPARLFQIDEIGRMLATMRAAGQNNAHLFNIATVLMTLYTSANTIWMGEAYADSKKTKSINQPCACLFGTSVPDGFYAGITKQNLNDGLLGRMLIFDAEGYGERQKPSPEPPPWELLEWMKWWANATSGNLSALNPEPTLIAKTPEASKRHEEYCTQIHTKHAADDEIAAAIWARAPEKSARLALIHACTSVAPGAAVVIGLESINWAIKTVNYCTRKMLSRSMEMVAENMTESYRNRVLTSIKGKMTKETILYRNRYLRAKELTEVLGDLIEMGLVACDSEGTATKTKTVFWRVKRKG